MAGLGYIYIVAQELLVDIVIGHALAIGLLRSDGCGKTTVCQGSEGRERSWLFYRFAIEQRS